MPLQWCSANLVGVPSVPTFTLAPLLVLMAGWPLAVLALIPVTLVTALAGQLSFGDALHRLTWLGIVPAALMLALGAASRRWLPNHILVYIFSRGFFGILVATLVAGISMMWTQGRHVAPDTASYVARLMVSLSEAITCGLVTAGLVAFRPGILSTYTDRLYLPR
jgi:uncharacterized membrane protein